MLVASLAIAVALIAALIAYVVTQATLPRINYSLIRARVKEVKELTKQLCPLSWSALRYASELGNSSLASLMTGNFAKLINKYSIGTYVSINTTCKLNWGVSNAYSNITLVANLSSDYTSVKGVTIKSGLYVNSTPVRPLGGGQYALNLSVMVCRCGECFYTPITTYNTNLTQLVGYTVTYEYLGNGVTEFIIKKVGGVGGPGVPPIYAIEVIYGEVKVIVSS